MNSLCKSALFMVIAMLFPFAVSVSFGQSQTDVSGRKVLCGMPEKDRVSDSEIERSVKQKNEENIWMQVLKGGNPPPSPFAACSDLGVENGWSSWTADTSTNVYQDINSIVWSAPFSPAANPNPRIVLNSAGSELCATAAAPVSLLAPGFGNRSIGLGIGAQRTAERITFPLTVTAQDTNFVYAHAIVMQDPGHPLNDQPYASLCIYDQNNNPIPCGCFTYTAGTGTAGWLLGAYPPNPVLCLNAYYKPWTVVGINLSAYIGQTLTVKIENVDCAQGAHWTRSYWDFACSTMNVSVPSASCGGSVSMCAPTDPLINYSYQWYQNGSPFPGGNTQCITASVAPGDTFVVDVKQPSGCNFKMVYAPQVISGFTASTIPTAAGCSTPGSATANANGGAAPFTYQWNNGQNAQTATGLTAGTYTVVITDSQGCTAASTTTITPSTVPPTASAVSTPVGCNTLGTATVNATAGAGSPYTYNWNNGQTTQNITGLQVGTYTVTVADASGCTGTATVSVTANSNYPTAMFSSSSGCLGLPAPLTDQSTGNTTAWSWDFGDGNTSTQQNPAHAYTAPGTYTIILIVSSSPGCDDTTANVVTVHPLPVSNFSADEVCAGNPTTFTDLSFIGAGSITAWTWSFAGAAASTQQNPVHTFPATGTYSVTLTVTSDNGCIGSQVLSVSVQGSPLADFGVAPQKQPITDPVFSFSDLWSSDVVQWTWYFGDGDTNVTDTDPSHSYAGLVTGNDFYNFNVCLEVQNQYGCWDSICKTVELIPEFTFYIPNTFTPNGDFSNDFFFGKGRGIKEYKIWVFDRWGNQIWNCDQADANVSWDNPGKEGLASACQWDGVVQKGGVDMNGNSRQLAQEDVYVWKVELTDLFDRAHNYVGHVNIVR